MPSTPRLASGVAVVTAAAGLAYKHRDKLTALIKRDGGAGDRRSPPCRPARPSPRPPRARPTTGPTTRPAPRRRPAPPCRGRPRRSPWPDRPGPRPPPSRPSRPPRSPPWVSPQPPSEGSGDRPPRRTPPPSRRRRRRGPAHRVAARLLGRGVPPWVSPQPAERRVPDGLAAGPPHRGAAGRGALTARGIVRAATCRGSATGSHARAARAG